MSNEIAVAVIGAIVVIAGAVFGYLGVVNRKGEQKANGTLYSEFKDYVDDLKEEIAALKKELQELRLAMRDQSETYKAQTVELETRISRMLSVIIGQQKKIDEPPADRTTP